MFRRIVCLLGLLVLLVVALNPLGLFLSLVEWRAMHYFKRHLGAEMTFEKVGYRHGTITFDKGQLIHEGQYAATFSQLRLSPQLSWTKRELTGLIEIHDLVVQHEDEEPLPPMRSSLEMPGFFLLNMDMHVPQARLEFADKVVYFDLEQRLHSEYIEGSMHLHWSEVSPALAVRFTYEPLEQTFALAAQCVHHDLASIEEVARHLFASYLPQRVTDWSITQGEIDGAVEMLFYQKELINVVGDLTVRELSCENIHLEMLGRCTTLIAKSSLDFSAPHKVETWNGDFFLSGGSLSLKESPSWGGMWDINDVTSKIVVIDGQVESSFVKGHFLGMEGELHIDHPHIQLAFEGSSDQMLPHIPPYLQKGFEQAFPSEHFSLTATLLPKPVGVKLEGILSLDEGCPFLFGCHFGEYESDEMPLLPGTAFEPFVESVKEQFGLSKKRLGWFRAEGIPLEKYVSPFLEFEGTVAGCADIEGTFDERYIVLFYEGAEVVIDHPLFSLDVGGINGGSAVHYFDLLTREHVGLLPLHGSAFFHKTLGLHFTDAHGVVQVENEMVAIKHLATDLGDLSFEGEIGMLFDGCAVQKIDVRATKGEGKMQSVSALLTHLFPENRWHFPSSGNISLIESGIELQFDMTAANSLRACTIQGRGVVPQGAAHFSYRYPESLFEVSEGGGSFEALGKQFRCEALSLSMKGDDLFGRLALFEKERYLGTVEVALSQGALSLMGDIEGVGWIDESTCSLTTCRLGDLVLDGTFDRYDNAFNLSLNHQKWGRVNLEGRSEKGVLAANILDLSLDLTLLTELFPEIFAAWHLEGRVQGCGDLMYDGEIESHIVTSFDELSFGGVHFGSGEHLYGDYENGIITIEGVEAQVPLGVSCGESTESYKLGAFHYDLREQKVSFDGFDFVLPTERWSWLQEISSTLFPGKMGLSAPFWLVPEDVLEGRLSFQMSPDQMWVYLTLKDGHYHLFNHLIELSDFALYYDQVDVRVVANTSLYGQEYAIDFTARAPTFSEGELTLAVHALLDESMSASWCIDPMDGWGFHRVEGKLSGLTVDLTSHKGRQKAFHGTVEVDVEKALPFITPRWRETIDQHSLGGVYTFAGEFTLDQKKGLEPTFCGTVDGRHCTVAQVAFDAFQTELIYRDRQILMEDFHCADWSGSLTLDQISLFEEKKRWYFFVTEGELKDFRLSRLNSPWTDATKRERPLYRSFYVPSLKLRHFQGELGKLSSLQGGGVLTFTNHARRTLFNNLLLLPTEISARIGLDLTSFIPVKGSIYYHLADGKIHFTELSDVYSEGKRSRFYLAENTPAYIDFEGNLNLSIKMKQYNLLMKLAELFIVTVKGTVLKPSYVFTNQVEESVR